MYILIFVNAIYDVAFDKKKRCKSLLASLYINVMESITTNNRKSEPLFPFYCEIPVQLLDALTNSNQIRS